MSAASSSAVKGLVVVLNASRGAVMPRRAGLNAGAGDFTGLSNLGVAGAKSAGFIPAYLLRLSG